MSYEEKLAFVNGHDFLTLIKTGQHNQIMRYVRVCKCLSPEEECALIKRGNHEEIMAYIAHHYLEPESFDELVKRGKPNEIRFYFSRNDSVCCFEESEWANLMKIPGVLEDVITGFLHYWDSVSSEAVLATSTDKEEQQKQELKRNFEYALLKTKEHVQIRFYLSRKSLCPEAEKLLEQVGIAEDKLVYHECWKAEYRYH